MRNGYETRSVHETRELANDPTLHDLRLQDGDDHQSDGDEGAGVGHSSLVECFLLDDDHEVHFHQRVCAALQKMAYRQGLKARKSNKSEVL